ncbi:excisionase family DNA-binding protein [Rhodopseudomonas telluris]|uniref:Excisionase family DNA-binding protein n=1 Tax=Rhodopseudomonas telluris TaxID=644215 RepID=A0ABV6EXK3_9BRAD
MEPDVLTTSQAAKLLGISVRTAQLLVESGSLTSWKTPGGHRRVSRADVIALMKQTNPAVAAASAVVVVLAPTARLPLYERQLSSAAECSGDLHSEALSASFAVGARLPAAVVVDLSEDNAERRAFLGNLTANPAVGPARIIVVGGPAMREADANSGPARIDSPQDLPEALRKILMDAPEVAPIGMSQGFPVPANEGQRLIALERTGLVDTAPEETFDRLTWLASRNLGMPISLMTLLTPDRQWFKSRQGLGMRETPRSWAFCNETILQRGVFSVENLAVDKRYASNPAVAGDPHFRFYAGAPVLDRNGFPLGSICVIDYEPRKLNSEQTQTLSALAALASDEVRLRAADRELRWALTELGRTRKP